MSIILKYADAAVVEITIIAIGDYVRLKIMDDGKGVDINMKKAGIGLENIKRRAGLLDGKVEIISSPGDGCKIIVLIPFAKAI